MLQLSVYIRAYCHLCDDMITALQQLQRRFDFELSIIDIDADSMLETRFGELVPVLMHEQHELCHYFLDETGVTAYLSKLR